MLSFCQNRTPLKKTISKNFLWDLNFIAGTIFKAYACSEIILTKTGQKTLAGTIQQ